MRESELRIQNVEFRIFEESGTIKLMVISFPKLILSIGVCLGAGIVGSFFTISSIPNWYVSLNKPAFSPPNWIFGPVWTILYILMGISLYLALSGKRNPSTGSTTSTSLSTGSLTTSTLRTGGESQKAVRIFAIQLVLNAVWSIIFFGMRNPALALVNIVALWIAIVLTIRSFYKINKLASYLLYPYLAWVSFATILNLAIVLLNS